MTDRKRKRHDDGVTRPNKKTATTPQGTVTVELVDRKDTLGPVLATTPGLDFPPRMTFKPYKHTKIHPSKTTVEYILQSSDHPRLDYLAREENDGSSATHLQDYIGVYDPATGKLQVVPTKKLTVRSTLRSETEELRNQDAQNEEKKAGITAQRHALAAQFGSKKSRKAIDDMQQNSIMSGTGKDASALKDDALATNVLQNMQGSTSAMPTKEELAAAVDSSKPRPLANLAAEYPSDVYTSDSVIGKDLMSMIPVKDWVDAQEKGEGVKLSSRYVAMRIGKLVKNKQIQKLKVLRFIMLAINFSQALKAKGRGPKSVPPKDKLETIMGEDVPGHLVGAIKRKFVSSNGDMPRWNIDNMMTHIAAAALIVDDYEVDTNDLREDLRLDTKEIKQYFSEIGCRITAPTETERTRLKLSKAEAGNHWMAKLKLPLRFPKVKVGGGKRGGR